MFKEEMETVIDKLDERTAETQDLLLKLWERSVRASHNFLSQSDIEGLIPFVKQGLQEIPVLSVAFAGEVPVGFIGLADRKIEMLFVEPSCMGKGVGRRLMEWGVANCNANLIDVNEQNSHALSVYEHWGFEIYERTEVDEQGNPFPILKMRLKG